MPMIGVLTAGTGASQEISAEVVETVCHFEDQQLESNRVLHTDIPSFVDVRTFGCRVSCSAVHSETVVGDICTAF